MTFSKSMFKANDRTMGGNISALFPLAIMLLAFYWIKENVFKSDAEKTAETLLSNIPNPDKSKVTISGTEATSYATQLENAMSGPGTDEDTIYYIFDLIKNEHDMRLIYKAFGLRKAYMWTEKMDLIQWLNSELSSTELSPLNVKLSWLS
jgi:hypothetical protein